MWSVEVGLQAIEELAVVDLNRFTVCDCDDLDIRAVNECDSSGAATIKRLEWEALSPRGALFLGELASVGFFGVEAKQLLSP